MSRAQFDSSDNSELRAKIDEAKLRLPMPALMTKLGFAEHAKKEAHCPWHSDEHPSFSVFQKADGTWWHNCFVGCSSGDEIAFLEKALNGSRREAINHYLEMAGFPSHRSKSREYPELPKSLASPKSLSLPESPCASCVSVSPVSNGQGLDKDPETELKDLAARNACTERNTATTRRFKLLRDLKKVEKQIGRELTIAERRLTCKEWHRLSQPFLDPQKTFDDYFARFLSERRKVRFATGEGVLRNALENVSKLSVSDLPVIPGCADAPESWRRILAFHRELWRYSGGKTYFLTCRDAAKAVPGLSYQMANLINGALADLGAIEIVRVGDARPNGGKASEFRYLLSEGGNGTREDNAEFEI
jgi:hypothetical protein